MGGAGVCLLDGVSELGGWKVGRLGSGEEYATVDGPSAVKWLTLESCFLSSHNVAQTGLKLTSLSSYPPKPGACTTTSARGCTFYVCFTDAEV